MAHPRRLGWGIAVAILLFPVAYLLSLMPLEYAKNHEFILQDSSPGYVWIYWAYCEPYLYARKNGPKWLKSR